MKTKTYAFELEQPKPQKWWYNVIRKLWIPRSQFFANVNEIVVSFPSLNFAKAGVTITISPGTLNITVIGQHSIRDLVSLTTANLALPKGSVGTIGVYFAWNHDLVNIANLSGDGTTYPLALNATEFGFGRWNAATFNAKSIAGTPALEYCLIEA